VKRMTVTQAGWWMLKAVAIIFGSLAAIFSFGHWLYEMANGA